VVPAGGAADAAAPRARLKTVAASILALAIVGAVPFTVGALAVAKRMAYDSGIAAQAKVLEVERAWLRDLVYPVPRRAIYRVAYEFRTAAGAPMRGEGTYVQSRSLVPAAAGDTVRIHYLPEDPASSYLEDGYTWFDALLAIGAGLLVWGGGAAYLWKRRKPATAPAPGS
jgi:hypothetical protein